MSDLPGRGRTADGRGEARASEPALEGFGLRGGGGEGLRSRFERGVGQDARGSLVERRVAERADGTRLVEREALVGDPARALDAFVGRVPGHDVLLDDGVWKEIDEPLGLDPARESHDRPAARTESPLAPLGVHRDEPLRIANDARLVELGDPPRCDRELARPAPLSLRDAIGIAEGHAGQQRVLAGAGCALSPSRDARELLSCAIDGEGRRGVETDRTEGPLAEMGVPRLVEEIRNRE